MNIILTILGGLIAGFSGILIEQWRRRRELRDRHLQEIKKECLEPLLGMLYNIRNNYYVFSESVLDINPNYTRGNIETILNYDIKWWESFSFTNSGADPFLYKDLVNHYPQLYKDLIKLEELIRTKYDEFLKELYDLLGIMENDINFTVFTSKDGKAYYPQEKIIKTLLFLILDIDKGYWPNLYSNIKHNLNMLMQYRDKFYNTKEANTFRDTYKSMQSLIDSCIKNVKEILHTMTLEGNCKYVK